MIGIVDCDRRDHADRNVVPVGGEGREEARGTDIRRAADDGRDDRCAAAHRREVDLNPPFAEDAGLHRIQDLFHRVAWKREDANRLKRLGARRPARRSGAAE